MHVVTFQPEGKTVQVEAGELLSDAAVRAGVRLAMPCGNQGRCGRCLIKIEAGEVRRRENAHLSPERVAQGWALACQTEVLGDVTVEIPPQRLRETLVASKTTRRAPLKAEPAASVDPWVRKVYLELPPPSLEDNVSDWDRTKRGLEAADGTDGVEVDLPVLRTLAGQLRAADWKATATLGYRPHPRTPSPRAERGYGGEVLLRLEAGDTSRRLLGAAVDIGTTTVACGLVDLRTGELLETAAEYNDQISCGEDVISRIIYSRQGGGEGLHHLQRLAVETINRVLGEACQRRGVHPAEIADVVVAGNTTMTHLFLGLDPQHLRMEPYTPTASQYPLIRAEEVGLATHPQASVWAYPTVAAYVGGDITSGVISSGQFRADKLTLFMDVGTNGEIVLGNADWLATCACSAGPAFEGAGVRCGMRATTGAIEDVTISTRTLEPTIKVLGNARPAGVCGSGMIAALAEMFVTGIVDRQGRIDVPRVQARMATPQRLRQGEHGAEYVLAWASESETLEDIYLTEVDINNLIRTKGAIYAGITSLVNSVGLSLDDVEQVLIGGSFGQHIDVEEAIRIGLLPDLPWDRFKFLGNTSLLGAYQALVSRDVRSWAEEIARKMTYLELIADNRFMGEYTSAMFLPHTDLDAFPSVKRQLLELAGTTGS